MRKRHAIMRDRVEALGEDIRDRDGRYAAHHKNFIAKVSKNRSITSQTGCFYKWYSGPESGSMMDSMRETVNYMRFENATGTPEYGTIDLKAERRVADAIRPPEGWTMRAWAFACSSLAYLMCSGFPRDAIRSESEILERLEDDEYRLAQEQLAECGVGWSE